MSFVQDLLRQRQEMDWNETRVPEWRTKDGLPRVVYAKPLSMKEMRLVEQYGAKKGSTIARLVKLGQLAFHDSEGRLLINHNEIDHFEAGVDPTVLSRVLGELGLMTDEEVGGIDEAIAFEDAEKNSDATPDSD